jgi:hypothetical protein
MIENTVVNFLITDATLISLLGITASDSRFYPIIPDKKPTGYYCTFSRTAGIEADEHIDQDRIQFICHGGPNGLSVIQQVARRIKKLLDVKDDIQTSLYKTDTNFYIYHSKYSGGDNLYEPVRQEFQEILFFEIEYQDKTSTR